jgi:hypothetical protein
MNRIDDIIQGIERASEIYNSTTLELFSYDFPAIQAQWPDVKFYHIYGAYYLIQPKPNICLQLNTVS